MREGKVSCNRDESRTSPTNQKQATEEISETS